MLFAAHRFFFGGRASYFVLLLFIKFVYLIDQLF